VLDQSVMLEKIYSIYIVALVSLSLGLAGRPRAHAGTGVGTATRWRHRWRTTLLSDGGYEVGSHLEVESCFE